MRQTFFVVVLGNIFSVEQCVNTADAVHKGQRFLGQLPADERYANVGNDTTITFPQRHGFGFSFRILHIDSNKPAILEWHSDTREIEIVEFDDDKKRFAEYKTIMHSLHNYKRKRKQFYGEYDDGTIGAFYMLN